MAPTCPSIDLSRATWRKSARSSGNGGACVEVANLGTTIAVRDSKNPNGPKLAFSLRTWGDFTDRMKSVPSTPD